MGRGVPIVVRRQWRRLGQASAARWRRHARPGDGGQVDPLPHVVCWGWPSVAAAACNEVCAVSSRYIHGVWRVARAGGGGAPRQRAERGEYVCSPLGGCWRSTARPVWRHPPRSPRPCTMPSTLAPSPRLGSSQTIGRPPVLSPTHPRYAPRFQLVAHGSTAARGGSPPERLDARGRHGFGGGRRRAAWSEMAAVPP